MEHILTRLSSNKQNTAIDLVIPVIPCSCINIVVEFVKAQLSFTYLFIIVKFLQGQATILIPTPN